MRKYIEWLAIPTVFLLIWLAIRWYKTPNVGNGATAHDFVGYLPDGDSLRLSNFRGKYVLLDFWGSWCGPCRQKNPELVALYEQYKNKDFVVVSVGIETKKENWLRAIEKDKLTWKHHVSDLTRFNDHVANLYGVNEIPTTFLIDKKGIIVGVNISVIKIKEILDDNI